MASEWPPQSEALYSATRLKKVQTVANTKRVESLRRGPGGRGSARRDIVPRPGGVAGDQSIAVEGGGVAEEAYNNDGSVGEAG
ncbi:hypothetical protein QR680_006339 [Steinernema hermaphroditum]|uniref:Uncharacterized protein n=1 Tax=Steinernema hermaphroditum TaxID=289476 RepID=A0AA39HV70_9BILA|nr:hypothetical protein QR680_006339 [Steinernema hermaphroditum]